jgi:predicted  nucleic acid-binding Zn-ribbon protein
MASRLVIVLAVCMVHEVAAFSLHRAALPLVSGNPVGIMKRTDKDAPRVLTEGALRMAASEGQEGDGIFVNEREMLASKGYPRRYGAKIIKQAKTFLEAFSSGIVDPGLLAQGFEFAGSNPDGPVAMADVRGNEAAAKGSEFYGFTIDPHEPTRVWFTARITPAKAEASTAKLAQSCSLTFNDDGRATRFTMHTFDVDAPVKHTPTHNPDAGLKPKPQRPDSVTSQMDSAVPTGESRSAPQRLPVPPRAVGTETLKSEERIQKLKQQCTSYEAELVGLKEQQSELAASQSEVKTLKFQLDEVLSSLKASAARKLALEEELLELKKGAADMAAEMAAAAKQQVTNGILQATKPLEDEVTSLKGKLREMEAKREHEQLREQVERLNKDLQAKRQQLVEAHTALDKETKAREASEARSREQRLVWDTLVWALSGRRAASRSDALFKIVVNSLLLSHTLCAIHDLAQFPAPSPGESEPMDGLVSSLARALAAPEVKNQIARTNNLSKGVRDAKAR